MNLSKSIINQDGIFENLTLSCITAFNKVPPLPPSGCCPSEQGWLPKSFPSPTLKVWVGVKLLNYQEMWKSWNSEQFSAAAAAKSLQSCPTLCDPIDGSPPGSAVPGILQARTLEWVAISFSNA